jgi:hypothetical protein
MLKSYSRDIILQVREFLERRCEVFEIASRMNLDPQDIQAIIDIINQIIT